MDEIQTDSDKETIEGDYKFGKKWQTDKTEYVELVAENGEILVLATVKKTGSMHLLKGSNKDVSK